MLPLVGRVQHSDQIWVKFSDVSQSRLMSAPRHHCCCTLFPFEQKTHLHKEEAWHDVGAGLLQASVIRKALHHPPRC